MNYKALRSFAKTLYRWTPAWEGIKQEKIKVSSRFFWKTQMKDVYMSVHEFVKTCDVWQSTNGAKFMKTVAPLHPIYLYNLVFASS